MGVIYRACDDVAEILIPFVRAHGGGEVSDDEVSTAYFETSLGLHSSREFWIRVGCDPSREDDYLARHELTPGLFPFLASARERFEQVWCLSNDVSEWSSRLRSRFDLDRFFDGFVISGDVGFRKPSPVIYSRLSERAGAAGAELLFVDDRAANVGAATRLGWQAVVFDVNGGADASACAAAWAAVLHPVLTNLA